MCGPYHQLNYLRRLEGHRDLVSILIRTQKEIIVLPHDFVSNVMISEDIDSSTRCVYKIEERKLRVVASLSASVGCKHMVTTSSNMHTLPFVGISITTSCLLLPSKLLDNYIGALFLP